MWEKEVAAVACPFFWQEETSAGRQAREGDVPGLRWVGMEMDVSSIGLVSGCFSLDEGETGDAVERVGLHFESGIGDLLSAA